MKLLGKWVVDVTDVRTVNELGDVVLDFREDGQLVYTIRQETKDQIIKLQYKIEGETIITDQPSAPQIERTPFSLLPEGTLVLTFSGVSYKFRRLE
ncbi:MAG: hypothetical protein K8S55_07075 [Phycisphaerae bacterium]|nr:hypothetical protein [Phycisphaerae bacterium]